MESLIPPGSFIFPWKEKFYRLLSDQKTGWIIIFLVICCRILQLVYFFNTRNDMTYQILGAQHLLEGHGLSTAGISANDVSDTIYQPLHRWPPGFSILFIPFYLLLGNDYLLAAMAMSIVFAIMLIFVGRAILRILEVPYHLINLFTLLSGFFIHYFYAKPCTDAIGVTFFVTAIYFTLLLIKNSRNSVRNIVAVICCLLFSGFIKYLYIPATFVVPLFLLTSGLIRRDRNLKKQGLIIFSCLFLAFVSFFIYQKTQAGTIGYITEPGRGLYPENLIEIFPFIPASFVKTDSMELLGLNNTIYILLQATSIIILAGLTWYCFIKLFRSRAKKTSIAEDFFSLSILLAIAIIGLLSYLSLTVAKEYGTWTYVEEPRYYGLLTVILHIAVFALYHIYRATAPFLKFLFAFLILLMIPEMVRGVIFSAHRVQRIRTEIYGWQYELAFQKNTAEVIKQIRVRDQNNIVLIGSSDWMTLRASLYTKLPIFEDVNKLNAISTLQTGKPVTLLAIIRDDHLFAFDAFVKSANTRFEGNKAGFSFYTYPLKPK